MVLKAVKESGFHITEIVSGGAIGVDRLGERYAKDHGVSLKIFPADWNKYGKSAGYRRNVEMAENADSLIAITSGSKGTQHMIDIAKKKGLKVYTMKVKSDTKGPVENQIPGLD